MLVADRGSLISAACVSVIPIRAPTPRIAALLRSTEWAPNKVDPSTNLGESQRVSNPGPISSQPELSVIMDSNAVRALGSLSDAQWSAFLLSWRTRAFTTAWVPRVVSEVAGSNLDRVAGLTDEALQVVVRSIQRFDELADGRILPDEHEVVRQSIYELAGRERPTQQCETTEPASPNWRIVVDHAKRLHSVDLVAIEVVNGKRHVILKDPRDPFRGVAVHPNQRFKLDAPERVGFWKQRTKCKRGAAPEERIKEIVTFLPEYTRSAATAPEVSVPLDVAQEALEKCDKRLFQSPFGYRLAVENLYLHLRATGDKHKISDNDMTDIVVASYLAYGEVFVTADDELRRLLEAVLADSRSVMNFDALFRVVIEPRTNP